MDMDDFAGNALAPNVLTLESKLAELSAQERKGGRPALRYRFPLRGKTACGLSLLGLSGGEAAGLLAGFGFGPLLDQRERDVVFAQKTPLRHIALEQYSAAFKQAGLVSSSPLFIYSASPFVIMVNERHLGARDIPHSWAELTDKQYRGCMAITQEDAVGNVAAISLYAQLGEDGLEAFAQNVARHASASVMPSLLEEDERISVCVAPWFFARIAAARPDILCIWPEEGALVFPLWLALRNDAPEGAQVVADYFTSAEFARESARLCLPCAHIASDQVLDPDTHPLYWPGWEFFRTLDTGSYARAVTQAFAKSTKVVA